MPLIDSTDLFDWIQGLLTDAVANGLGETRVGQKKSHRRDDSPTELEGLIGIAAESDGDHCDEPGKKIDQIPLEEPLVRGFCHFGLYGCRGQQRERNDRALRIPPAHHPEDSDDRGDCE